jgi:hypothetical protein
MGAYLRKSDLIDFILDDGHLVVNGTESSAELDEARKHLIYNEHVCTMCLLVWSDADRARIQARARKGTFKSPASASGERKDRKSYYGA